MRWFFPVLFIIFFLDGCGVVQNSGSTSRLSSPSAPLEVIVPCDEENMECVDQEANIRSALEEGTTQCFEGLEPELYHFRLRIEERYVILTSIGPSFNGERMTCLYSYMQSVEQVGEDRCIQFILRYTPPDQLEIAP